LISIAIDGTMKKFKSVDTPFSKDLKYFYALAWCIEKKKASQAMR
jgi:hypothetical protein